MNKSIKSKFRTIPVSLKTANELITEHHRHNKKVTGHKFSIGIVDRGALIGVAVCGRPVARLLDDGGTLEILRVCIKDPAPKNACSYLYARCEKIWRAMGGERIITYTLETEPGASLRAVNWQITGQTRLRKSTSNWNTRNKKHKGYTENRRDQKAYQFKKNRWEKILVEEPFRIFYNRSEDLAQ